MSVSRLQPIITLTTDFGLADHYVGTMKGVILGRCPEAQLVDITHQVPPFSIYSGAYSIDQAAGYFPPGTVHLLVIDPGVGTSRRGLCVEALGQVFIAPDNGVLSLIVRRDTHVHSRELTNRDLWLESPSSTFHGRDIFAPVAAAIASRAAKPEDTGPIVTGIHMLNGLEPSEIQAGIWQGRVLSVDHFGNVITNFRTTELQHISAAPFSIEAGARAVKTFFKTFGEAPRGVCFAYFGSSGYIELGINQQSAAEFLCISPGDALKLETRTAD